MELEGCYDTGHFVINDKKQNEGTCAVMCKATCCSRCAGAAGRRSNQGTWAVMKASVVRFNENGLEP